MRNSMFRAVVFLLAMLVTGCGALTELRLDLADKMFGREPLNAPTELKDITTSINTRIDWSTQTGETGNYDYKPALEAGFVYTASVDGDLTKLDASNGSQVWFVNVGEPISGGVGIGGGLVLVGTKRGNVFAYDVNGKQVWVSKLSSEVLSQPQYSDGVVIARSGDNHIYGLDAIDGTRKWVYERKVPALSLRSSAGIVVDSGAVYAGFSGGKMAAIRADNGSLLWEVTVAVPKGVTEIERIADITSLPVVAGPVVYAVAYQGRVAAVDRVKGKVLWNREISSYTGMSFSNEKIYLSHALGSIYSLDYATGRTFWRQGDLVNRRLTAPAVINNTVVVGDLEGYVHFLGIDDGKFNSRIKVGSKAVMAVLPGQSASQAIVATRGGGLYAVIIDDSEVPSYQSNEKPDVTLEESDAEEPASKEPVPVAVDDELDLEGSPYETNSDKDEVINDESKSILFKKDAITLPDEDGDSGPGIRLPKSQ